MLWLLVMHLTSTPLLSFFFYTKTTLWISTSSKRWILFKCQPTLAALNSSEDNSSSLKSFHWPRSCDAVCREVEASWRCTSFVVLSPFPPQRTDFIIPNTPVGSHRLRSTSQQTVCRVQLPRHAKRRRLRQEPGTTLCSVCLCYCQWQISTYQDTVETCVLCVAHLRLQTQVDSIFSSLCVRFETIVWHDCANKCSSDVNLAEVPYPQSQLLLSSFMPSVVILTSVFVFA